MRTPAPAVLLAVVLVLSVVSAAQAPAEPSLESLRAAAQARMREDRARFSADEMRQIETLYQSANKDVRAEGARDALQELVAKYPASNRAGCALLYVARMVQGAERENLLKQAIASHGDARYGDGTQVGAFARALLADHYRRTDRVDEAKKLAAEVAAAFPGAVDHSGNRLAEILRKLGLL